MSQYGREMHKFITGEIRTDGWKSEWRREFERRSAEHARPPKIAPPQIRKKRTHESPSDARRRIVRDSLRRRRNRLRAAGMCVDCGKEKRKKDRTLCQGCLTARSTRETERQIRVYTKAA